ncbi:MAG: NAD-dependent succinate-semialdehyde dehydrogenase [Anaerolineae bacterium]
MDQSGLFIHGRFVSSTGGTTFPVLDKATGQTIATVPESTAEDISAALGSAQEAWRSWRQKPAHDRAAVLHAAAAAVRAEAESLARLLTAEVGKPLAGAQREAQVVATLLDFFAEEGLRIRGEIPQLNLPDERVLIVKEPVGVVVALNPSNYPLILLSWKLGAALAAGCTVVSKPSEDTPLATLRLAEIVAGAGLPPGVFNVITGYGHSVGKALVEHAIPRKIAFTGGVETGKKIAALAAQTNKRVTLELGGQCPALVCDDADLEVAVPALLKHSFDNAGQYCYRINRMYVQAGIYHQFLERLAAGAAKLKVGPGRDPASFMGPLVNGRLFEKSLRHVEDALERGATLRAGGQRLAGPEFDNGYFLPPTILAGTDHSMLVMTEETFGPVVGVMPMDSLEEAIGHANNSRYGLAAYIFSRDVGRALRAAEQIETGSVWVNNIHRSYNEAPFGGFKESGLGREKSHYGLDEYLELKTIYLSL